MSIPSVFHPCTDFLGRCWKAVLISALLIPISLYLLFSGVEPKVYRLDMAAFSYTIIPVFLFFCLTYDGLVIAQRHHVSNVLGLVAIFVAGALLYSIIYGLFMGLISFFAPTCHGVLIGAQ